MLDGGGALPTACRRKRIALVSGAF